MGDIHEFSGFRVDSGQRRLTDASGKPISLSSRAFDLLTYFVDRPGELLDKATLMREIWPDTVVEENNLNQVIASLRKALGDSPKQPRFVATEAGRGYRFIAAVKSCSESEVSGEPPETDTPSVAVLPFVNMSPDRDQEYFSDGITEELISHLSKLGGLHVAGRTSSFAFKNQPEDVRVIAEKLSVAHILEGSVRKAGDRVRIAVQLVKAADGYRLWSDSFDRVLNDIFAIQDEIAEKVATALSVTLGVGDVENRAGGTRNFAAYNAYLEGLAMSQEDSKTNLELAVEKFEEAVTLDDGFADAWSQLSAACVSIGQNFMPGNAAEWNERADHAALSAATAAPDAVSSSVAVALNHALHRKWFEAEKLFKRVLKQSPADPQINIRYATFLAFVGRITESQECLERAVRAEPLSMYAARYLTNLREFGGDFDGALAQYRKAKDLPGDRYFLDITAAVIGMSIGDYDMVRTNLRKHLGAMAGVHKKMTTTMLELMHQPDQALAELRNMYRDHASTEQPAMVPFAVWASFLGDDEFALEIYRGLLSGPFTVFLIIWRPLHKGMRKLPGFKDLLHDLGLVDYWRRSGNWGEFCRPLGADDFECV